MPDGFYDSEKLHNPLGRVAQDWWGGEERLKEGIVKDEKESKEQSQEN